MAQAHQDKHVFEKYSQADREGCETFQRCVNKEISSIAALEDLIDTGAGATTASAQQLTLRLPWRTQHAGLWPDLAVSKQHLFEAVANLWSRSASSQEQTADDRRGPADLEQQPARRKSQQPLEYETRCATMWSIRNCRLSFITWGSIAMLILWTVVGILSARQMVDFALEKHSVNKGLDPDIAGDGILIGLFISAILTVVSLVFGHFHTRDGAAKEIGMAHFANLASLLIKTFKAEIYDVLEHLTREERLIAAISNDVCCTGLRMSFSDKTVLASRVFMTLCSASRLLGLICMVILLQSIAKSAGPQSASSLYWYGSIGPYEGPSWSLWALLATRAVSLISDTVFFTYKHAFEFDKAQKGQSRLSLHSLSTVRGTALLKYVENIPMLFMDVMAVVTLTKNSSRGSLADWGQSAALATALTSAAQWAHRTVYVNILKSDDPDGKRRWRTLSLPSLVSFDAPLNDTGHWMRRSEIESKQKLQKQLIEACQTSDTTLFDTAMADLEDQDVNYVDQEDNMTPLLLAVANGNLKLVKKLKEIHHASSTCPGTSSAIALAAAAGRDEILSHLLTDPSCLDDPCGRSREGISPLQLACQNGHSATAKALLKHASVVTELISSTTREPLWSALTYPLPDASMQVLSVLLQTLDRHKDFSVVFRFLVELIRNGDLGALQKFRDRTAPRGFPVGLRDQNGWTLLHWAASKTSLGVLEEILSQITGDTDTTVLNKSNSDNKTALHIAAQAGHLDVALRLLGQGSIETHELDHNGRSALSYAAQSDMLDLVRRLPKPQEQGAEDVASDSNGRTPLSYAAEVCNLEMVDLLLDAGADPHLVDAFGMLPLAYAFTAIKEKHPNLQPSTPWRNRPYQTNSERETIDVDHADFAWRSLQKIAARWMPTRFRGEIDRWKTAVQDLANSPTDMATATTDFMSWLCTMDILDPTPQTATVGFPGQTAVFLPGCLLYFVAERRLQGFAAIFNHFQWRTDNADLDVRLQSMYHGRSSPGTNLYALKALLAGKFSHCEFLIEDMGIDINWHSGIFLRTAIESQRVESVALVLDKGPDLELAIRAPLAVNAGNKASKAKREIGQLLLSNGACVNPVHGIHPLFEAASVGDPEEVARLLKHGASIDHGHRPTVLSAALDACKKIHSGRATDDDGPENIAVHETKLEACRATVMRLIQHGAYFSRSDRKRLSLDECKLLLVGAEKQFHEALISAHAYIEADSLSSDILVPFTTHGVRFSSTTQDKDWDPDIGISWHGVHEKSGRDDDEVSGLERATDA